MLPLTRVPFWVPILDPQPNQFGARRRKSIHGLSSMDGFLLVPFFRWGSIFGADRADFC